jgi:hypothetical protein
VVNGAALTLASGFFLALSPLQIQAVVDLALREPGAHKNYDRVIFYDARYWAKTEPGRHRKLQIRVL